MPECNLDETAKLQQKVEDFKRRYTDHNRRHTEHERKPHTFDMDVPEQATAAKAYDDEATVLNTEAKHLADEAREIGKELQICGIQTVIKAVQDQVEMIVTWPDGSTTSIPIGG
jgi:predicted  nucleic acid-binding Zn-ribbon protein